MSKVFKGIGKVFKKAFKAVKKIAVPLLAAAAIFFTAGAALGLAPALGGFGGAVSAATAGLGNGMLGSVVTGAITQAGYGAAIGGAVSAATGGDFMDGAKAGALTGAITGGVGGAVRSVAGGAASVNPVNGGTPTTPPITDPAAANGGLGEVIQGPGTALSDASAAGSATGASAGATGGSVGAGAGVVEGTRTVGDRLAGGLSRLGGFVKDNKDLIGASIAGVGQGMSATAAADADRAYLRERQGLISRNYEGVNPGANYRDIAPVTGQPGEPAGASERYGSWEYQYSEKDGRIIRVPVGN